MGKVLRVVAVIAVAAAVAYFAPQLSAALVASGLSASVAAAVTAVATIALTAAANAGLSLLAGKPTTAGATPSVFRQSIANSFIVYGRRRVGGLLIFFHPVGKTHRYFVIAVAGHRCKGVTRWLLGDEQVTVDAAGKVTSGAYANNAWLWFYRGGADQLAHPTFVAETGGKWTAAHRGRGTALIYAKFKMTDEVVQAGMPNITAEIEGKDDVLDPRTNTRGYTRNGALIFYDWMELAREEGGFGSYPDEIDWDWVSAQANVCDEDVPLAAGGTEKRYAFDAYLTTGAAPSEVRDTFVTCCAGAFTYSGGLMLMRPGYYVPPSKTLHERDLAGAISVPALLGGDEIANEVTGTFIDPTNLYQPKDIPTRSVPAVDVRQISIDLPHVTSITLGQRILEIRLRKAEATRRVTWPMNIVGIGVSTLDTVQLATPKYGLSNYSFQIVSWGLSQDFSVVLQLEEHGPELFEWNAAMELSPGEGGQLIRAQPINETTAQTAGLINTSSTIGAMLTATTSAIAVPAHRRRYDDKIVQVAAATVTTVDADGDGTPDIAPEVENLVLHSESFDNAAWSKSALSGQIVVTANASTAPDGTASADRIDLPAGSAGGYTHLAQLFEIAAPHSASIYFKGVAGGETVFVMMSQFTNGPVYRRLAAALTTEWQRFVLPSDLTGAVYIQLGVDSRDASQAPRGAQSFYAWGAQLNRGGAAFTYRRTDAAAFAHDAGGGPAGLVAGSEYALFYDDAERAGGAVTVLATTRPTQAANGPDHPGRHYLGSIRLPTAAGTETTGGGASPPGWNGEQYYSQNMLEQQP